MGLALDLGVHVLGLVDIAGNRTQKLESIHLHNIPSSLHVIMMYLVFFFSLHPPSYCLTSLLQTQ